MCGVYDEAVFWCHENCVTHAVSVTLPPLFKKRKEKKALYISGMLRPYQGGKTPHVNVIV